MSQMPLQQNGHPDVVRPLVFVVDDEPMLLELATMIVEPLGFRVRTFRDPLTALREYSLSQPLPVLLITDFAMHQMNGMDLIRDCRKINPHQKVLLVSGTVDAMVYRDSPQKPDAFLAKPYQTQELVNAVNALATK
ncbi:MAG TPA: response regulator [Verrucomicrobiae bacterium]|nr:response regulator [Verrucomicrobiae bacterium]